MNIKELTAREKSVLLAQLVGWRVFAYANGEYSIDTGQYRVSIREHHTLYTPTKMMFAWMVLNWAADNQMMIDCVMEDGFMEDIRQYWALPPAVAQAAWLDKILELAIEAGLVKVDEVQP